MLLYYALFSWTNKIMTAKTAILDVSETRRWVPVWSPTEDTRPEDYSELTELFQRLHAAKYDIYITTPLRRHQLDTPYEQIWRKIIPDSNIYCVADDAPKYGLTEIAMAEHNAWVRLFERLGLPLPTYILKSEEWKEWAAKHNVYTTKTKNIML